MSHELPYLTAVGLVVLALLALGARRRILLRVAVRNVGRRKTQVVLAVAGLLVATSILSGSFVIGDSLKFSIRSSVFLAFDVIDETIVQGGEAGAGRPFDIAVYEGLDANRSALPSVDGLGPRVVAPASVVHPEAELFEGRGLLVGFDPAVDPGVFVRSDGRRSDGSELGAGQAFLSARLAGEIEAEAGDTVTLFAGPVPAQIEVLDVLRAEGKGAYRDAAVLFLPLAEAQALVGTPGQINEIVVSNVGDAITGAEATDAAVAELDAVLGAGHPFAIVDAKRQALEAADAAADNLTELFVLLGTFTVIAGLMLIVSIFTVLAEERKTEMGIQRAIGMRRSQLTELFTLEGFLYALASSALGAVAGLVVAGAILLAINAIFVGEGLGIVLWWEGHSLLLGFALGFLLTIATIALTSGRISRLNIVRAVRNIPEPTVRGATRAQIASGALLLAIGLLAVVVGYDQRRALFFSPGMAVVALGIAQLAHRAVGTRLAFTAAGAFIVAWLVLPQQWFSGVQPEIALFIAIGVSLVLGGVLLVVFNNDVLLGVLPRLVGPRRRLRPVLKTAVAYPMNRPVRSGLMIAIFALVIFTIVVMAHIQTELALNVRAITRDASGGYEVFGITNPRLPLPDFADRLAASPVAAAVDHHEELLFASAEIRPEADGEFRFYEAYGFGDAFADRNGFTFFRKADRFPTDRDVWTAVRADAGLAILDRSVQPVDFGAPSTGPRVDVGDRLVLRNATGGERIVEVAGILNSFAVRGAFVREELVREHFDTLTPSFFLVKVRAGEDADGVAKDLERLFLPWQMQTIVISTVVEENLETTLSFFDLLQGYLAMGLLVGIAGLGIVTLRNVTERRAEMGVLRALGYRKGMIVQSVLLENSYVALLGIFLGVVLGILLSYRIHVEFFTSSVGFAIPWDKILLVVGVAYGMNLVSAVSPAIRASRVPPARALRYVE